MEIIWMTLQEYEKHYGDTVKYRILERNIQKGGYCKADMLESGVIGMFSVPDKKDLSKANELFGFSLEEEGLILIENHRPIEEVTEALEEVSGWRYTTPAHTLAGFMSYLIMDDVVFLQKYEERLTKMEEELLEGQMKELEKRLLIIRKELLKLDAYYQQLADMSDVLEENAADCLDESEVKLFRVFTARAERLHEATHILKEYAMQLRELYQTQIDIRQNKVMKVLTIVTTIFMPLTLITGWYGMNFINMPELASKYGYVVVIIASILLILGEVILFKVKKWFG